MFIAQRAAHINEQFREGYSTFKEVEANLRKIEPEHITKTIRVRVA